MCSSDLNRSAPEHFSKQAALDRQLQELKDAHGALRDAHSKLASLRASAELRNAARGGKVGGAAKVAGGAKVGGTFIPVQLPFFR